MYNLPDCSLCSMPVLGLQEKFGGAILQWSLFWIWIFLQGFLRGCAEYIGIRQYSWPCAERWECCWGSWCRVVRNLIKGIVRIKVITREWCPCSCLLEDVWTFVCAGVCSYPWYCFQSHDWSRFISTGFRHNIRCPLMSWVALLACTSKKLLTAFHLWASSLCDVSALSIVKTSEINIRWLQFLFQVLVSKVMHCKYSLNFFSKLGLLTCYWLVFLDIFSTWACSATFD